MPLTPQQPRHWNIPTGKDYLRFFIGIPTAVAVLFSLVGIRLTMGMPYLDSLGYMLIHMWIAWWSVSIGAALIKYMFRSWKPPVLAICTLGYLLLLIPTAFVYQSLGELYGSIYPSFAANRLDDALPNWGLDYFLHFIRYSIPALPLYLAGIYGYRAFAGVFWFSYPVTESAAEPSASHTNTTVKLIGDSKLPQDSVLIAIKAEQHYIHIWTNKGTDMIRYRFKDLDDALKQCNGGKVHRSWWVNFDEISETRNDGRKLELVVRSDALPEETLLIPVSTSYRNTVLEKLEPAQKKLAP